MPRRQSKFLFACARLTRETTNRNPKTDSTLRFRPLVTTESTWPPMPSACPYAREPLGGGQNGRDLPRPSAAGPARRIRPSWAGKVDGSLTGLATTWNRAGRGRQD